MTPEQDAQINKRINECAGQVLGLQCILTSILLNNPGLRLDEAHIGKLILSKSFDTQPDASHADIRSIARRTMHSVLSERAKPN